MFSSAKLQDFFEKLLESSTETAPSSASSMEKSVIEKRLRNFLLHSLIARRVKTEAPRVFQGRSCKLEAPHLSLGKCSFYDVFLKKRVALS